MGVKGINSVYGIIHAAADADFVNYAYFKVYAGATGTVTINGVAVTMTAGSDIDIVVRSISATANVYVIGEPLNVITGNTTLSNYPEPT